MIPTAVQTANRKGTTPLKAGVVRTARVLNAPTMPIRAHNIHAGKKAPNNSKEGATPNEQPVTKPLRITRKTALGSDGLVIMCATHRARPNCMSDTHLLYVSQAPAVNQAKVPVDALKPRYPWVLHRQSAGAGRCKIRAQRKRRATWPSSPFARSRCSASRRSVAALSGPTAFKKGQICTSEIAGSLVALTRALISSLIEKLLGTASGLRCCRDCTVLLRIDRRFSGHRRCGGYCEHCSCRAAAGLTPEPGTSVHSGIAAHRRSLARPRRTRDGVLLAACARRNGDSQFRPGSALEEPARSPRS
jgi:hypothetical protein